MQAIYKTGFTVLICFLSLLLFEEQASAKPLKLCQKANGGVVAKRKCKAKKGETQLDITTLTGATGPAGPAGADGAAGMDGADGTLGVYGDGSDGAYSLTSGAVSLPDGQFQFTDFTVASGASLYVPSGTTIRCTGKFTNNGTIYVEEFAEGGSYIQSPTANSYIFANRAARAGLSGSVAGNAEYGFSGDVVQGGNLGVGLGSGAASRIISVGRAGGGAGGAGGNDGLRGGGTLRVLCFGEVENGGTISADGQSAFVADGSGGGAGGFILLASSTKVTNSGTLTALGGPGGAAASFTGPGGGGGGGLIHQIAPMISNSGTIDHSGGSGGAAVGAGTISAASRFGGGGGGACGGGGGGGGTVLADGSSVGGGMGSSGFDFQTLADPSALFLG